MLRNHKEGQTLQSFGFGVFEKKGKLSAQVGLLPALICNRTKQHLNELFLSQNRRLRDNRASLATKREVGFKIFFFLNLVLVPRRLTTTTHKTLAKMGNMDAMDILILILCIILRS